MKPTILNAMATIAMRLGVDTTPDQLQRRFLINPADTSSDTVMSIARELDLDARRLHLKSHELPKISRSLPAILCTSDGVLILETIRSEPKSGTVFTVRDPARSDSSVFVISEDQLKLVWTGEVILIKRIYKDNVEEQPFGMAWLWGQVFREKALFRDIAAGAVVSTVFAVAPPFIFMIVLDKVLVNHSYSTLNVLVGAIILMLCFETLLGHLRRYLTQVASTRIDGRLNLYLEERLLRLPMEYFEHNATGRTLSRLNQMWQIRSFLTGQLFGTFIDSVPLLGLVPAMLILEWRLSLMAFSLAAVIFVIILLFMKPIGKRYRRVVAAEQAKHAHLVETLYGMRTIKSLALEGRRRREWDSKVAEVIDARHSLGVVANYPQTLSLPFERLIYSGTLAVGAYMVLAKPDVINPGALVAFAMMAMRLAQPLVKLAHLQENLTEVRAGISEVAAVVNAHPEAVRVGGLRGDIVGHISFKDVRFRYSQSAPLALDDVSFCVPAGTMLGIMGRSGSGKTTVTRLLQRLNSSYEGMIKIDGMDLREIDLNHLRTHIGVVPQENFLFSGTIRENIAMAKPNASLGDIARAAQLAGAEEFIERLPRGYDTVLEEGATNLSGGQRQRLAIARALLIDPPVLILDEATSALDAESEAIVNANLKRMASGRTVLSISHRLSMLVECDAILVLERGKVYDIGTHEELLQRCDIYKHLWYQQNRHLDPRAADAPLAIAHGGIR
jgi:ATP-binding cassette subfamily B protein